MVIGVFAISCASTQKGPSVDQASRPEFQVEGGNSNFSAVMGKEWRLVRIETFAGPTEFSRAALEAQEMGDYYILRFDKDALFGMAAPNRYRAPYHLGEGASISIETIAGTLMASFKEPPGLQEKEYYTYLMRVFRWDVEDDRLNLYTLNFSGESVILVYQTY
jgi:hypothetical protein